MQWGENHEKKAGHKPRLSEIVILNACLLFHVLRYADRCCSGNGNGRVYSLTYLATDRAGNATARSATVSVPKNMKK